MFGPRTIPASSPNLGRLLARYRTLALKSMLAVFLCLVAPGGVKLVQDIVVATTGVECCEDEDCQGSSTDDGCPKGGAHCASCSHGAAAVLPVVVAALELEFVAEDQKFQSAPDDVFSPGYRAPPFRPPTA